MRKIEMFFCKKTNLQEAYVRTTRFHIQMPIPSLSGTILVRHVQVNTGLDVLIQENFQPGIDKRED